MWIVFVQKDKLLNACDTAEADCIRLRIKNGLSFTQKTAQIFLFLFFPVNTISRMILYDPECE